MQLGVPMWHNFLYMRNNQNTVKDFSEIFMFLIEVLHLYLCHLLFLTNWNSDATFGDTTAILWPWRTKSETGCLVGQICKSASPGWFIETIHTFCNTYSWVFSVGPLYSVDVLVCSHRCGYWLIKCQLYFLLSLLSDVLGIVVI